MYDDLKKICNKYGKVMFATGIAHLFDVAFCRDVQNTKYKNSVMELREITDEQIAKIPGTGWATAAFLRDVVTVARDIANAIGDNHIELIQFCEVENIFDTKYYAPNKRPISWDRLSEIADRGISHALYGIDEDDLDGIDYALQDADLDLDDEEREFFGVPVREEEEW